MTQNISDERIKIGSLLYKFAWAVEITAVFIGLLIALATFLDASESENANFLNGLIGAVPLVMISIVELTKIPFAQAFYKTTASAWKFTFAASLLLLSFVTFETFFNGLERNFAALLADINDEYNELQKSIEEKSIYVVRKEDLSALTIESIEKDYSQKYDEIFQAYSSQAEKIKIQREDTAESISTQSIKDIGLKIQDLKDNKKSVELEKISESSALRAFQENDLKNLAEDLDEKKRVYRESLDQSRRALASEKARAIQAERNANIFTRSDIRERNAQSIADIQATIKRKEVELKSVDSIKVRSERVAFHQSERRNLNDQFDRKIQVLQDRIDELSLDKNKRLSSKEKDIAPILQRYESEIISITNTFNDQKSEINAIRQEQLVLLKNSAEEVKEIDALIYDLSKKEGDIRHRINEKVADNNIYRIAMFFTNERSAADISRQVAARVAGVWFGSIAFLCAYTGVMLALGSLVIADPSIVDRGVKGKSGFSKLTHSVRRFFVHSKVNRRSKSEIIIKEVVKEVPVDRVVFKEIPVEVIKKEIVHIPLWTADKNKINLSNVEPTQESEKSEGDESKDL